METKNIDEWLSIHHETQHGCIVSSFESHQETSLLRMMRTTDSYIKSLNDTRKLIKIDSDFQIWQILNDNGQSDRVGLMIHKNIYFSV